MHTYNDNTLKTLARLCMGPPKPKLRFIVGDRKQNTTNSVIIEATLV